MANMIAAKEIPDISVDYPLALTQLLDMKVEWNMDAAIKSAKFDLNRLRPEFLALQTDGWRQLFELWAGLYQVSGATNVLPSDPPTQATQSFLKGELDR